MKYYDCLNCGKRTPNRWRRKTAAYCSIYCRTRVFVKVYEIPRPTITGFSGDIKLIDNMFKVNAEYYDWLNQYKWHVSDTGYAVRRSRVNGKNVTTRMHRLIIGAGPHELVDHIDRDKWNNVCENLRIATPKQNVRNTERYDKARRYCWDKNRSKWLVRIGNKHIGRFNTEQEAIDKVKEILYGRDS